MGRSDAQRLALNSRVSNHTNKQIAAITMKTAKAPQKGMVTYHHDQSM